MKRVVSIAIALMLLVTVSHAAEVTVTIPEQKELLDGKYIVSVDISENTGFASLQLELFYNENTLTCEKVIAGEVVKGMLADFNPKATGERTSAILSVAGISNTTENGNLATFVFEKPKKGNPEIEFVLVEMMSADGKKVDCKIKVTDNYGDFEEEKDSQTGGNVWKPSAGGNKKPGEIVIHEDELKIEVTFKDVSGHWASEYITQAVKLGIVSGMPDGTFAPDREMTRAEAATILWNMAKKPSAEVELDFTDVQKTDWYYKAVAWAFEKGYIKGVSDNEFDPSGKIPREQAMTILYRYAGEGKTTEALEKFEDKEKVSEFALSAMCWAVQNNIVEGVSETEIAPRMSVTRAQMATIMVRYLKQ
ncbi:MAG: S-layer homology domain-containing protein [Clostridia bacterium]|nr:S-layer homology domain-containing protein [Clostridia bacterium]